MPELPEVETICRELSLYIVGQEVAKVEKFCEKLRVQVPSNIESILPGARIKKIFRRAKYIIIELDIGKVIVMHLGMSGKLLLRNAAEHYKKHDHLVITLANDEKLVFNDPRRFGLIDLLETERYLESRYFCDIGVEPLEDALNANYLKIIFQNKKSSIKNLIMNNNILVGVGNIYAAESLFLSKINPTSIGSSLKPSQLDNLIKNIRIVLNKAIQAKGSSLKDYVSLLGKVGNFQDQFFVYNREGEDCKICSEKIKKIRQSGRSTYFCPNCQKL